MKKKCLSCQKDIPDTAVHCVFCGAKQGPVETAAPAQKTMMAFTPGMGPPPPAGGGGSSAPTMMAGAPPTGGPPAVGHAPATARTMMAGMPPSVGPPSAAAPTMMVGPGGAPLAPAAGSAPGGYGAGPIGPSGLMGPPGMGSMGPGYGQGPATPASPPLQVASPHLLQPQAPPMGAFGARPQPVVPQQVFAREMVSEPWAGTLRVMLILFGLGFVATFALPWHAPDGQLIFAWDVLAKGNGAIAKVWPIVFAGAGLLALVTGVLPLVTGVRGLVATAIGVLPLVLARIVGDLGGAGSIGGPAKDWQAYLLLVGMVAAPVGLLVRSQYRHARIGRVLASTGALLILVPFLVPDEGEAPLVSLFKLFDDAGDAFATLQLVWMLALPSLALLAFLAWAPPEATAGTGVMGWMLVGYACVSVALSVLVGPAFDHGSYATISATPFALYSVLNSLAFPALAAVGLATLIGKTLEPSAA